VGLKPHAFYRLTYGDGIQARPGQQESTTVQTLSPGILAEIGNHWTADYTPTWTFYSNKVFSNTVSHSANVNGQVGFTDGGAQIVQTYNLSKDPLIETGRQTRRESSDTSVSANYRVGSHSRIEVTGAQDLEWVEGAPNTKEWTNNDWFHYQFSDRIDTAVGLGMGYVSIDPGSDMKFTRGLARIGWRPVDKVSIDLHGGREHRTFSKTNSAPLNSPTYGVTIDYQPFETTHVSFSAERAITPSLFYNQATENRSWMLAFNQRLLQRFSLSGGYGKNRSHYLQPGSVIIFVRDDESSSFHLRLSTSFLRRGTIGVIYQRTRNSSSIAGYTFASDQTGLEIGYRY
jgi:hypothetical protein